MQTLLLPSDRKSGICHRLEWLRILSWPFPKFFKVINFEIWLSWKWWELAKKMLKCDFYRGWYLPSTVVNVVLCDLDLNFPGYKFETLISRKRWELSQKNSYDFYRGEYSRSNGTILTVALCDHDRHFQGQTSCHAFVIKNCTGCSRQICLDSHSPAVELLLLLKSVDI